MTEKEKKENGKERLRLGEYLLKKGLISDSDLAEVLKEQKATGDHLGEILINRRLIDEKKIYQILAEQMKVEFFDLYGINVASELISLVPKKVAKTYYIIPVKIENDSLMIAMVNPADTFAIDELRSLTDMTIKPVMSSKTQILAAIEKFYGGGMINEALELVESKEVQENQVIKEDEDLGVLKKSSEDAPIVKLVNAIIENSVNGGASDVHIEPSKGDCQVRNRIDGVLHKLTSFSKQSFLPVVSRIKIMANMDIAERRLPQDGSFRIEKHKKQIDVRVSTYPTMYGEKLVMRLLIKENFSFSLNELGFEPHEAKVFEALIQRPSGIILVVGPTGSGKSTTLYSAINRINSEEKNIITIEDPIEYEIDGVSQSQINVKAGFTFANSLRSMMRQDPDIILVGEIRDLETAELAIRASLTGHLVFSTMHTNNAFGAVARLIDMGIEPFLISSSLIGVLAQRLIRVICPNCKEVSSPPSSILDKFSHERELAKDIDHKFFQGKGCEHCRKIGFKGREGVYEMLEISGDKMRNCITSNFQTSALKEIALKQGFRFLKENGFRKAAKGNTTLSEALQVTELN